MVRQAIDAYTDRGIDAWAEFFAPEVNWRAIEGAADDVGEMDGVPAMRAYLQDWLDMFDDLTIEILQLTDVGDDRVVAEHHIAGRAKISGVETELRYAVVYTVRNGKIVRGREYATIEQAFEVVG